MLHLTDETRDMWLKTERLTKQTFTHQPTYSSHMVAERCPAATWEQMDVPVPQDVEQIVNVPVGVRQQVLLNGDWVTVTGDVAEYTKKLITSVARSKRKVNLTVVPDSQYVESERESRTRDACSAVKSMQDWETDVKGLISDLLSRLQEEAPFQVRNTSCRDEVTSQATEKKEDFEADTAKHSSVLETAVSRSTLDGEISSRDRISQYTMEQTLGVPMPEMVKQLAEVPKTISQNRIQQRTMKQIVDDPVVQIVQIPQVHVVERTAEIPVMTQTEPHGPDCSDAHGDSTVADRWGNRPGHSDL